MHAGLRRRALAEDGLASIASVSRTPAHRSDGVIAAVPPREKKIALGNKDADRQAKHALSLHPSLPPAGLGQLDTDAVSLRKLVSMHGAVLPCLLELVPHPTGRG